MSDQEYKENEMEKDIPNQEVESENIEGVNDLAEDSENTENEPVESENELLKAEVEKERNNFLRLFFFF